MKMLLANIFLYTINKSPIILGFCYNCYTVVAGTGGVASVQKVAETVDKSLKFGENDLVYGIYNNPSIAELQQSVGGKFLNSFIRPDGNR